MSIKLTPRARLRYRKAKNGKKRPPVETLSYSDKNKDGRWVNVSRVFNREDDHYQEVVTDEETGEVIHTKNELLSAHIGHGTEKTKK